MRPAPHVVWFKDIRKADIPLVGGKGANLGEMTHAGIPVPNGFCVGKSKLFRSTEAVKTGTAPLA